MGRAQSNRRVELVVVRYGCLRRGGQASVRQREFVAAFCLDHFEEVQLPFSVLRSQERFVVDMLPGHIRIGSLYIPIDLQLFISESWPVNESFLHSLYITPVTSGSHIYTIYISLDYQPFTTIS